MGGMKPKFTKLEHAYCVFCDKESYQQITLICLLDEENTATGCDLRRCPICRLSTIWKDGQLFFPPIDVVQALGSSFALQLKAADN